MRGEGRYCTYPTIYMHVHAYKCWHICVQHTHSHTHTHTHHTPHTHTPHTHTHTHTHTLTRSHAHTHTHHIHTCTHYTHTPHTHMLTCSHTHTHIHTLTCSLTHTHTHTHFLLHPQRSQELEVTGYRLYVTSNVASSNVPSPINIEGQDNTSYTLVPSSCDQLMYTISVAAWNGCGIVGPRSASVRLTCSKEILHVWFFRGSRVPKIVILSWLVVASFPGPKRRGKGLGMRLGWLVILCFHTRGWYCGTVCCVTEDLSRFLYRGEGGEGEGGRGRGKSPNLTPPPPLKFKVDFIGFMLNAQYADYF